MQLDDVVGIFTRASSQEQKKFFEALLVCQAFRELVLQYAQERVETAERKAEALGAKLKQAEDFQEQAVNKAVQEALGKANAEKTKALEAVKAKAEEDKTKALEAAKAKTEELGAKLQQAEDFQEQAVNKAVQEALDKAKAEMPEIPKLHFQLPPKFPDCDGNRNISDGKVWEDQSRYLLQEVKILLDGDNELRERTVYAIGVESCIRIVVENASLPAPGQAHKFDARMFVEVLDPANKVVYKIQLLVESKSGNKTNSNFSRQMIQGIAAWRAKEDDHVALLGLLLIWNQKATAPTMKDLAKTRVLVFDMVEDHGRYAEAVRTCYARVKYLLQEWFVDGKPGHCNYREMAITATEHIIDTTLSHLKMITQPNVFNAAGPKWQANLRRGMNNAVKFLCPLTSGQESAKKRKAEENVKAEVKKAKNEKGAVKIDTNAKVEVQKVKKEKGAVKADTNAKAEVKKMKKEKGTVKAAS